MLNHPVPAAALAAIGDVTVSFSLLESVMQGGVTSMVREHQRVGQIITSELSFKQLRALAISLYIERHGKDADYPMLRGLLLRAAQVEQQRNRVAHSIWGAGDAANSVFSIKSTAKETRGLQWSTKRFTVAELEGLADQIKQVGGEIEAFYMKLTLTGKAVNNPIKPMW